MASSSKASTSKGKGKRPASTTVEDHLDRYKGDITNRGISRGKFLDDDFFTLEMPDIKQMLTQMGWYDLLIQHGPTYPNLVREFYTNLTLSNKSRIGRSQITLTPAAISDAFGIRNKHRKTFQRYENVTATQVARELLGKDTIARQTPSDELPSYVRMIFKIVVHCITPRQGNVSTATHEDLEMVWCVMNGKQRNLGKIVYQHMVNSLKRPRLTLPYGFWVTLILQHHGISFSTQMQIEHPLATDCMNAATCARL